MNTPTRVQPISTSTSSVTLTPDQQSQITKLQSFVAKGIISQSEFEQKKLQIEKSNSSKGSSTIVSSPGSPTTTTTTQMDYSNVKLNQEQQTQLDRLGSLRSRSIITESEFQKKKLELMNSASNSSSSSSNGTNLSQEQESQIHKLQQFVNKGIISQSEFDQKKLQILQKNGIAQSLQSVVSGNGNGTVLLTVFLNNIPASPQLPLTILLNRTNVMYTRQDDIPSSKSVVVKGNIPSPPHGDLIVTLTVLIPALGIESEQEFNLSQSGPFVLIGVDVLDNKSLTIKQQTNEHFPEPQVNLVGGSSQVNVPTGSSDIYITFAGIPANENQPFEIYINQNQAHKSTQDMGLNHKGMIKGQVPKSKRTNEMSSPDHEIALLVKVPALGIEPVEHHLNLTQHGSFVMLSVVDGQIEITQSDVDHNGHVANEQQQAVVTPSKKQLSADELVYLQKLADLRNAGILTEDEFNKKKNDILNG